MPSNQPKPVPLSVGLPPADELEALERVIAGAAKRMLDAFEKEAEHRRLQEMRAQEADIVFRLRGQIFGLVTCLAAFGVAGYAAHQQEPWIGSIVGGTTIVALVSIFVLGRLVGEKKTGR